MCATQMMKTEIILNSIGSVIHLDPGPILMVVPREADGDTFSKDRLAPMLRDTPVLRGKVADVRSRDSGNTILHKVFPGGHFTLAGAISPSGLSARPIRYLFCDEIDKYPASAGTEGDPISLAEKRLATFWNSKKILTCSPTVEGLSRIDKAYKTSDQRKFNVPCPKCQTLQELTWANVQWDDTLPAIEQPATARYRCQHCPYLWNDVDRWRAIKKGRWVAHTPFNGIAGFHISEIYSPWKKLSALVQDFLEKKDDQQQLKTFINTSLAETWIEKGEAPPWKTLYERREEFPVGRVPRGGLFLTAGADVQKDRIEIQVVAWGRRKENWSVDYIVIPGDTSREEVWQKLDSILESRYASECGPELAISKFAIDSGYATNEVYAWVRRKSPSLVMATKGLDRAASPVGQPTSVDVKKDGKKIARGCKVWPIATGIFKSELYGWLRLEKPTESEAQIFPPGYCHHPQYQEEFFKQLTAEQLVPRVNRNRYTKHEWQKTRDRNEALDTWVCARAAAAVFGIDRFKDRHWQELEGKFLNSPNAEPLKTQPQPAPPDPSPTPSAQPVVQRAPMRRSGRWLGDRRGWFDR
jgi:phage terminase large subunit GpA-like protein